MKNKIELSENHRRVISVILRLIEKDMDYIEELMDDPKNGITYRVEKDIEMFDITRKKEMIRQIRDIISKMYSKYDLYKEIITQTKIINAKKIHLWAILIDSYSDKLNKYGKMDSYDSIIVDEFINELIDNINSL